MPGPVSDSYDPEFGTGDNAHELKTAIISVRDNVTKKVFKGDASLKNIIEVVHGKAGRLHAGPLSEKEWRVIRFCLNRALETI